MLTLIHNAYNALADFRQRRARAIDFYRGRQWSDTVFVNGQALTEEQYIRQQGRAPLKQNMIRPPLRNLIGQFRSNPSKPIVFARNREDQKAAEMMSVALESVLDMNDSATHDARQLEEFLISGCAISKTAFQLDPERQQAIPTFHAIDPDCFFISPDFNRPDGSDANMVGELLDMDIDDVIGTYAHNDEEERRIRTIYREATTGENQFSTFSPYRSHHYQHSPLIAPTGKCRVIELWRKESNWQLYCHDHADGTCCLRPMNEQHQIEEENQQRHLCGKPLISFTKQYASHWHCYHLSPNGDVLWSGESPFLHGSHPYIMAFYPLVGGECWGLVEDLIDQQKMINRNMILFDFINASSAKGVLLVPEDCIPDDLTLEDIADEWARCNGVIKIRTRAGAQIPQQITSHALHPGLNQMIELQLRLMGDIGGVHDAIQGKATVSGTPSSLYAQQSQNSATNTLDYIASFDQFLRKRDKIMLQLIRQFYTSQQYIRTMGTEYSEEAHHFDPEKIRNVDFDNAIVQGHNSPAFRALADDTLMQLLQSDYIDLNTYLENCSLPLADKLRLKINNTTNPCNATTSSTTPPPTHPNG